jgi:hypothetical protein
MGNYMKRYGKQHDNGVAWKGMEMTFQWNSMPCIDKAYHWHENYMVWKEMEMAWIGKAWKWHGMERFYNGVEISMAWHGITW